MGSPTFDPDFNCPTHFAGGYPSCPACVSKQPRSLDSTPPAPAVCECCGKTDCSCWSDPRCGAEKKIPPAPADDVRCVCGEPTTKGVVHRTDGPCFHRPGPRWDADPLAPEDHAKCAAERHPADDAGGAEAMRAEAWAVFNAYGNRVVLEAFEDEARKWCDRYNADPAYPEKSRPFRVVPLYALPLPARREEAASEAVVEAARVLLKEIDESGVVSSTWPDDVPLIDALRAALRGTRPEGHGGGK